MSNRQKRQRRPVIDLEELRNSPDSFLYLRFDDPVLRKLETYRLHKAGFAVTDTAKAFGFDRRYLYEFWDDFEVRGTEALINKHWGSAPRKRTPERDAAIIRAKAISPKRSDKDLADGFGVDRTTVYRLLKEHGLQDLHRIVNRSCPGS